MFTMFIHANVWFFLLMINSIENDIFANVIVCVYTKGLVTKWFFSSQTFSNQIDLFSKVWSSLFQNKPKTTTLTINSILNWKTERAAIIPQHNKLFKLISIFYINLTFHRWHLCRFLLYIFPIEMKIERKTQEKSIHYVFV